MNNLSKAFIIVVVCMFGLGKTNENGKYLSITTSKNVWFVTEGMGPLKSIFSLSMGLVALIRVPSGGI